MDENEPAAMALAVIYVEIDGEKVARVESALTDTAADLRNILLAQDIQQTVDAQFLDAKQYPLSLQSEKTIKISDLIAVSTSDANVVQLATRRCPATVVPQLPSRMTFSRVMVTATILGLIYFISSNGDAKTMLRKQVCPWLNESESSIVLNFLNCSIGRNVSNYLEGQIREVDHGQEIFVNTGSDMEKVDLSAHALNSITMYDDWVKNEATYKADYEWYTNMKSDLGHCAGHFSERIVHSNKLINDNSDSIKKFTDSAFEDWPQKLRKKINIENELEGAIDDDADDVGLATNDKISTNMYVVAWKRGENGTIRIHAYVTIFERTAGHDCHFNADYWSGNKDKITNAKKYFMLTKVRTNPIYKNFLLGIHRA